MLAIQNLSMRFGAKILFKDVSLQFNPGHRYGLVGANGCGKSTFIKLLTGELSAEAGEILIPSQVAMGSLKQDHYLYEQTAILDVVLMGKQKLWDALEQKKALLQKPTFSEADCLLMERLEKTVAEQEGYMAASEAARLLEGLGIREEWHAKPLHLLSGGYKLRVLLAQVFFSGPSFLVLDEPTNHLDLYSIKWLEGYLKNFPGTLMISSHDREFLNSVCTHIADVDYGTIKIYKGNYEDFLTSKQQDREQKEALLAKHEKRRGDIQGFIDRFGAKATKARQAQSKARLVDKLVEEIEALDLSPSSRLYPKLKFTPLRPSGISALTAKNISKAYGHKKVLNDVSFELERGDRLAIVGPNGIGKSTLLEIVTDHLAADQGTYQWGHATRIAYFPQDHHREAQGDYSLLEWLAKFDPTVPQEQLRGILGQVLFSGDTVHQPIQTLSGGETARLILAKLMLFQPNVLIFDEPTNHLDMEAIDALTEALKQFEGTLLFVSHNRYFVSQLATSILEITHQGVKHYKCTYAEYLEKQATDHLSQAVSLKQRYKQEESATAKTEGSGRSYEEQKKQRNLKVQLKKKVAQLEEESSQIEEKIKQLEDQFASEVFYQATSRQEQEKGFAQKRELEALLEKTLAEWERISLELQKEELAC